MVKGRIFMVETRDDIGEVIERKNFSSIAKAKRHKAMLVGYSGKASGIKIKKVVVR